MRFVLFDAVERVGSIDTDVVIEALEETSVETSARKFVFTDSHGVMVGENVKDPDSDYTLTMFFNGKTESLYLFILKR